MRTRPVKLNEPKPGSLKFAAMKIGISLPMVYKLIKAGKLRSYKVGRAHRVRPEAIEACLAQLEHESATGGEPNRVRLLC